MCVGDRSDSRRVPTHEHCAWSSDRSAYRAPMLASLTHTELIATIAVSLSAAMVFGFLARKAKLSPIVGYMLAGILVGPQTPGFVADQRLTEQLSEIGISLLMFGVGLHFSLDDLLAVRRIAVPGAVFQSLAATVFGALLGVACGWTWTAGIVFGLALSVASTVVLIRGLTDIKQLHSLHGHVAVGWLIVEDLFTVLILVALPAFAVDAATSADSTSGFVAMVASTLAKVAGLAVLYAIGTRVVPWFLRQIAKAQSKELFTLAVLGIALGVAYGSAVLFSVSMALGAFLGGMVVGRSELSHQAAADALPLRDAFAVLFFVSVGMLFEPAFLIDRPMLVLATVAIVVVAKPAAALLISLAVGYPIRTGVTVGASLAQIGEFSFILGGLGRSLGMMPADAYQAIVAAALLTIALNPLCLWLIDPVDRLLRSSPRLNRWIADRAGSLARVTQSQEIDDRLRDHVVLCGYGRTGSVIGKMLRERGIPFVVVEQDRTTVSGLRKLGILSIHGDAANEFVLERTAIANARLLLVTVPDPLATHLIVDLARRLAPAVQVVARAQSPAERVDLAALGAVEGVSAELELAIEMSRSTLLRYGVSQIEAQTVALDMRRGEFRPRNGARVVEVVIDTGSPSNGKALSELGLGKGALVMTIERDGRFLVPDGRTRLVVGDRVLLVLDEGLSERVRELV